MCKSMETQNQNQNKIYFKRLHTEVTETNKNNELTYMFYQTAEISLDLVLLLGSGVRYKLNTIIHVHLLCYT